MDEGKPSLLSNLSSAMSGISRGRFGVGLYMRKYLSHHEEMGSTLQVTLLTALEQEKEAKH